jgi:hypothetical protein
MNTSRNLNKYLFNTDMSGPSYERLMFVINKDTLHTEPLFNLAAEFCAEFNLKIDGAPATTTNALHLVTPNGFYAGHVAVTIHRGDDVMYQYHNNFTVRKSRNHSDGRMSRSINSLIRAVKKNDEIGTEKSCLDRYAVSINNGLNNIKENTRASRITNYGLGDDFTLDAVMVTAGVKEATHEIRQKALDFYRRFTESTSLNDTAAKTKARFINGGFYVVGLANEEQTIKYDSPRLYVGEVTFVDGKFTISNMSVKNSPGDNFFITTAMAHAKTKYESRNDGYTKNAYKIPFIDVYDDELDMVIAYQDHSVVWVLIPKVAP